MDPTPDSPLAHQLDLLRVVCCVAWADGDVSPAEKQLLEKLVSQYFPAGESAEEEGTLAAARQLAAWTMDLQVLDEVLPRLTSEEDRLLALKLAYMMVRVDRRPEDDADINPGEKVAYRRLVEGLGLDEQQVREAEWAAEKELAAQRSPWAVLTSVFAGLGAWPTPEVLETPGVGWL
ncbi:MAG: TerB family tellurite resistance protein [Synechococcaceae cyanobacterium]|nr:TerB family tellurite resistance protein [Synechococcaceae cyanobacterium]